MIADQRLELVKHFAHYAETPWPAGGESRLAHDAEVQVLLETERMVRELRERLELEP